VAGLKKLNNGSAQDALKCLNSQKIWLCRPKRLVDFGPYSLFGCRKQILQPSKFGG